jgi:hypothetical protein
LGGYPHGAWSGCTRPDRGLLHSGSDSAPVINDLAGDYHLVDNVNGFGVVDCERIRYDSRS